MNASRQSALFNMDFSNNGTEILGRWVSPEQPGDGMTPKIGYGDASSLFNDGYTDSHFVESGYYLKLSTLALGYTIPKAVVKKLNMTKIRFYVQGQNLLTITGYSGLDPQVRTDDGSGNSKDRNMGTDYGSYGMPRQFILGVNVTF